MDRCKCGDVDLYLSALAIVHLDNFSQIPTILLIMGGGSHPSMASASTYPRLAVKPVGKQVRCSYLRCSQEVILTITSHLDSQDLHGQIEAVHRQRPIQKPRLTTVSMLHSLPLYPRTNSCPARLNPNAPLANLTSSLKSTLLQTSLVPPSKMQPRTTSVPQRLANLSVPVGRHTGSASTSPFHPLWPTRTT